MLSSFTELEWSRSLSLLFASRKLTGVHFQMQTAGGAVRWSRGWDVRKRTRPRVLEEAPAVCPSQPGPVFPAAPLTSFLFS